MAEKRDRWSNMGRLALYTLVWGLIVGCVIYSATLTRRHRQNQTVDRIEIIISDSAMYGNLITTPMVKRWIADSNIKTLGQQLSELAAGDLERSMLKNGFVDKAKIYPTYSGALRVEVTQRRPVLRLLMNGYNGYTTREGYIFEAPNYASLYVPIVTGAYRPPFPPSYRGSLEDFIKSECKLFEEQIMEIEREKYPLFEREQANIEDQRELRRMFIKQGWFESDEAFDQRVVALRAKKADLRRLYRYRTTTISEQIEKISQKQRRVEDEEKKLMKRCEDFMNLINFVHIVENDKFWSSEIVQIIASQSQSGDLRVNLAVRSGDFEVLFGPVKDGQEGDGVEERLDKLLEFYQNGLKRVGWDKYRTINVEYKNQVVCK